MRMTTKTLSTAILVGSAQDDNAVCGSTWDDNVGCGLTWDDRLAGKEVRAAPLRSRSNAPIF